jgi:hypothetical protein
MAGAIGGGVITACTMGLCPVVAVSWLTGLIGFLVVPIAMIEIAAGAAGLALKKEYIWAQRLTTHASMAGLLAGSVTSAIGGAVDYFLLNAPEVQEWEATPD